MSLAVSYFHCSPVSPHPMSNVRLLSRLNPAISLALWVHHQGISRGASHHDGILNGQFITSEVAREMMLKMQRVDQSQDRRTDGICDSAKLCTWKALQGPFSNGALIHQEADHGDLSSTHHKFQAF